MKNLRMAMPVIALLIFGLSACDSDMSPRSDLASSDEAVFGKVERVTICHVDSETGAIDLLSAPTRANHIGNPAHTYGGISDYLPDDVFATGVGTEDSDGNGVADGCEPITGNTPVGTITADINRGNFGADRGIESAAGNLVADAQLWATAANGAQIAFMNPGGVRSDLRYAQSGTEGDGVVTFAEAFTFQPFGNTLLTMPMTGAQIVLALQQQCQPVAAGRPFLHLGVSEGLTYDLSKTIVSNECTSVSVGNLKLNGVPVDPAQTYYVTVNNFISEGGDNFPVFATIPPEMRVDGGNDLLALVKYFRANSPVDPPSTDRVNELN